MPLYLELRNGHETLDASSYTPGTVGPVLGPFIGVRIWRDEIRVVTSGPEESLHRVGDWIIYDGKYFADAEIVSAEKISTRRKLRLQTFNSELTEIP